MGLLVDLLFPPTDALVFGEVVVVIPILVLFVVKWWNQGSDKRLFSVGVLVFVVAFMAARTLH